MGPNYKLHILWWVLIFPPIVKETNSFTGQEGIISLDDESWTDKKFSQFGCPLITFDNQILFNSNRKFTFTPNYLVLETDLEDEDNVYVFLDDIDNVLFHLYGFLHPQHPNYKINATIPSIEKCEHNDTSCDQLIECNRGIISDKEESELLTNAVYVSWKASKSENQIRILVQYQNKIITCSDSNEAIDIQKFVMYGTKSQMVSTTRYTFKYNTQKSKTTINIKFNSMLDNSIFFYTSKCRNCEFSFNLKCVNNNNVSQNNNLDDINFVNSLIGSGWEKTVLFAENTNSDCKLTITTNSRNDNSFMNEYWAITNNAAYEFNQKDLDSFSPVDNSWKVKRFFEYGYPLITSEYKKLFSYIQNFTFPSDDFVNLKDEDNIYISYDSVNIGTCGLLSFEHQSYKIDAKPLSISKCKDDTTSCKKIDYCNYGIILSEELPGNDMYISWRTNKIQDQTQILVQCKNRIIDCIDHSESSHIQNFVMCDKKLHKASITRFSFKYITRRSETITDITFNSTLGNSIFFYTTQCISCEAKFTLKCNDGYRNDSLTSNANNIQFANSFIANGWQKVTISGPNRDSNCTLSITTGSKNTMPPMKEYWLVTQKVGYEKIKETQTTATAVTTTSQPVKIDSSTSKLIFYNCWPCLLAYSLLRVLI